MGNAITVLFGPDISTLWTVKDGSLHLDERRAAGLCVTSESSLYSSFSSDVCERTRSSTQVGDVVKEFEEIDPHRIVVSEPPFSHQGASQEV